MFAIQLTVKASGEDRAAAEEKGFEGVFVDIDYPVVPRKGEYFTIHGGIKPLKVKKVIHWGPAFADGPWTEIYFKASLKELELLLEGDENSTYPGWCKVQP